jgi:hypothetical protein
LELAREVAVSQEDRSVDGPLGEPRAVQVADESNRVGGRRGGRVDISDAALVERMELPQSDGDPERRGQAKA